SRVTAGPARSFRQGRRQQPTCRKSLAHFVARAAQIAAECGLDALVSIDGNTDGSHDRSDENFSGSLEGSVVASCLRGQRTAFVTKIVELTQQTVAAAVGRHDDGEAEQQVTGKRANFFAGRK